MREYENYGKDVCCGGAAAEADRWVYAAPVGSFKPNRFGLYDMLGNVSEWTEDCYDNDYDRTPRDGRAYSPTNCYLNQRVYRGGSFQSAPDEMRIAKRGNFVWTVRNTALGFRVAKVLSVE
jgi:formylglycine-generating enzyme required for sulfatase activity